MSASNGVKKAVIVIIVLVVLGAVFYLYNKNEVKAPTVENPGSVSGQTQAPAQTTTPQTQTNVQGKPGADYTPPQTAGGGENLGSNVQVYEVDFDGTQFSPSPINIKVNDWVFFKNKSQAEVWVMTNSQITPPDYPKLDSLKAIVPGGEYKFQFNAAGAYVYENKLNPPPAGSGGTVVVSK
jgi:plastocyanin